MEYYDDTNFRDEAIKIKLDPCVSTIYCSREENQKKTV
jgi:hypothetical protein